MTIEQNWNILTLHQRQRFVFNQVREWFSFIWKTLFNSWIHWKPIPHNLLQATSWSDYQSLTYRGFSWQKTEDASPCPRSPSPACWEGYRAPQASPPPRPKEPLVCISHCPSPDKGPETISRWGPPQTWSGMAQPSWTQGASDCCICLGEKKSSKATRQVAQFPSHIEERSGGSRVSHDSYVHYCLLQEDQGRELNEAWKAASPREMTPSGFCVFVLFS